MFSRGLGWQILWVGLLMGILTIGTGYWYWASVDPKWQTMIFVTLTFTQMANVLAIRSERDPLFYIGLLSNKMLLAAVLATSAMQLAVVYIPFLQSVFHTQALSLMDLAISLSVSAIIFHVLEFEKWFRYRFRLKNGVAPTIDSETR